MLKKKINQVSSLFRASIVAILGLIITSYAAEAAFITLEFKNDSDFNIWVKQVESITLVSGNVEGRIKQSFTDLAEASPLAPGGDAISEWNNYAPGINKIEWEGLNDKNKVSKDYKATGVKLALSKSSSSKDQVEVNFELSKDRTGKEQTIPFKYKEQPYVLVVKIEAKPVIWKGSTWNETYYSYHVEFSTRKA